ncbi:MBL fold metallo-hydrolase [Arthrobacter sp. LAR12-1-1.1]|uniref:MBL fold metallo-hydrolase n=1 Tax=Arthrobacter sp. LAR12-1-1.1 TaxID=3135215 RepID=UPI0034267352
MSLNFEVFDLDFPAGSPNKSATLVIGPSKAMLVDAGFTRADGHRLVAAILDSGKELETVFISHADPDFYFGLEVFADAFPDATILATPIVIEHIQATFEGKLKAWAALGANLPTRLAVIAPLNAGAIELDGYRFDLRGGSDLLLTGTTSSTLIRKQWSAGSWSSRKNTSGPQTPPPPNSARHGSNSLTRCRP